MFEERTLNIWTTIYFISLVIAVVAGAISVVSGYVQHKISGKIFERTREEAIVKANQLENQNIKLRLNVADLEIEVIESKRKYLEILERFSLRTISKDDKQTFIEFMIDKPKGKIGIKCWNDPEAYAFAQEIERMLKDAGFETNLEIVLIATSFKGLAFGIKSESSAPPYAGALQHAFSKIGISIPAEIISDLKDQQLLLYVGYKQ